MLHVTAFGLPRSNSFGVGLLPMAAVDPRQEWFIDVVSCGLEVGKDAIQGVLSSSPGSSCNWASLYILFTADVSGTIKTFLDEAPVGSQLVLHTVEEVIPGNDEGTDAVVVAKPSLSGANLRDVDRKRAIYFIKNVNGSVNAKSLSAQLSYSVLPGASLNMLNQICSNVFITMVDPATAEVRNSTRTGDSFCLSMCCLPERSAGRELAYSQRTYFKFE